MRDEKQESSGSPRGGTRLHLKGIRTSKGRVRRLMHEHGLLAPMRVGRAHGPKAHDRMITPAGPTRCGAPT